MVSANPQAGLQKFKSILCQGSLQVNLSVLCQDFAVWTIPMEMVVGRVFVFENQIDRNGSQTPGKN